MRAVRNEGMGRFIIPRPEGVFWKTYLFTVLKHNLLIVLRIHNVIYIIYILIYLILREVFRGVFESP